MLSNKEKINFRSDLFRHLDGIVTAPTALALFDSGITNFLLQNSPCSLKKLTQEFGANEGYLNIALRILCSQGWLTQSINNLNDTVLYETNELSDIAFRHFYLYKEVVDLLKISEKYHARKFEKEPFLVLEKIFLKIKNNYELGFSKEEKEIQLQILKHIEGIIIGPTIVHLGMSGMFHKYFMEASFRPEEFHKDPDSFQRLLDIFVYFKWFTKTNGTYQFTAKGIFFARRASAYGVTVSYIPTLRKLDQLIFSDPNAAKKLDSKTEEGHVDREMNVWGSGGAHSNYFKIVDQIIIELFNKPIEEQPKGILDMGCGNGAFIQHLYYVIEQQTIRGKVLDEHPLTLVGVDYNEAALKISKGNLIQADIWAKVIWGDIGKPARLASDLKENYGIDLKELLNVRTFLDHNRAWEPPKLIDELRLSNSTGAYAFRGKRLPNNLVEESLLEHFKKWTPYVQKFGLLLIELHTVNPSLVANNLGSTAATAYDATHGFSDQYIIEVDAFIKVLAEAGLHPNNNTSKKFPDSDLATVTVNLFSALNT
ncbi:MAG: class I SAM-dependent methyltransferase [Cyclobacteriaceae bacterium]|nr:class I SAM-dependent methyltransferase [Cyclobacteriaceae bacterium]